MNALLQLHDVSFSYGDRSVLSHVSFRLGMGEILMLVGPSGCGKTTLLRLIAGTERPASGTITLDGIALSGPGLFVEPEKRPVGMVFQGLALFPHLTVAGNVGFGLHGVAKAERAQRVADELTAVGLTGLEARYPHELSGGQQQRVAIARSMVRRPRLMLFDEPFSDLDAATRAEVRGEILRTLRAHGTAAIVVTHDHDDALHLADRMAEMENGRLHHVDHLAGPRNTSSTPSNR